MKFLRALLVMIAAAGLFLPAGKGLSFQADGPVQPDNPNPRMEFSGPDSVQPTMGEAAAAQWSTNFSPRGLTFDVYTVAVDSQYAYFGGGFVAAGDVEANYIARWDPVGLSWSPMGDLQDAVYAIIVHNGQIYACGEYFVVRWDAGTQTWEYIGYPSGYALAMTALGDYLYVGGNFEYIEGVAANRVARYHIPSGSWQALGSGVDRRVRALASDGVQVYIGGEFTEAGGMPANRIAAWSPGSQLWDNLAGGVQGSRVTALDDYGGTIYVGGTFTQTGTVAALNVAVWNGSQWGALGDGVEGTVRGISASGSGVYAAGDIYASGTPQVDLNYAARWNPGQGKWTPLGTGLEADWYNSYIFPDKCYSCAVAAGHERLYYGGSFEAAGGTTALHAAAWNPSATQWEALYNGPGGQGLDEEIKALAVIGTDVYAGGWFERVGDQNIPYIAKWDSLTKQWSPLGQGVNWGVEALAVMGDNLYVGGRFGQAGGIDVRYLARWNTTTQTWHPVGSGADPGPVDWVEALAVQDDQLFVGGYFTGIWDHGSSIASDHFAVWDATGQSWSTVADAGLDGPVFTILPHGDDVYVGGGFYQNSGSDFEHVARLDTNTGIWHAVGDGLSSNVHHLEAYGQDVLASGAFLSGVRRWDSASQLWQELPGGGFSGGFYYGSIVYDLVAAPNGDVFAGGTFTQAGNRAAYNIAQWSPVCEAWFPVDKGMNARVYALALQDENLYAGGEFSLAGDHTSAKMASILTGEVTCTSVYFLPMLIR